MLPEWSSLYKLYLRLLVRLSILSTMLTNSWYLVENLFRKNDKFYSLYFYLKLRYILWIYRTFASPLISKPLALIHSIVRHFDSARAFLLFPSRITPSCLARCLTVFLSYYLLFLPHYFLYPAVLPETQGLQSFVLRSNH